MSEKLCMFCNHLYLNTSPCGGDYPDPAQFECGRGHFKGIVEELYGFRRVIKQAETCRDYEEASK